LLALAGFRLLEVFAGFDGRPLLGDPGAADEHVYVTVAV